MRRLAGRLPAPLAALALLLVPLAALAATWGAITPGETARRDVEARYGRPSREQTLTEEGRAAVEWTYATDRAPRGLDRMVVSFGLLRGGTFLPDVVRALTLYPKPGIFRVKDLSDGWGKPDAIGTDEQTGRPAFRYDTKGLLVILDRSGEWAEMMVLAPQTLPAGR